MVLGARSLDSMVGHQRSCHCPNVIFLAEGSRYSPVSISRMVLRSNRSASPFSRKVRSLGIGSRNRTTQVTAPDWAVLLCTLIDQFLATVVADFVGSTQVLRSTAAGAPPAADCRLLRSRVTRSSGPRSPGGSPRGVAATGLRRIWPLHDWSSRCRPRPTRMWARQERELAREVRHLEVVGLHATGPVRPADWRRWTSTAVILSETDRRSPERGRSAEGGGGRTPGRPRDPRLSRPCDAGAG